nr:hypothetical protein [Tanacetum cinerariifolium]
MDLLSFIRNVDPTKVRVAERQHAKDKPRLLETTVGRVVLLLPVAPARASSELEASVDKLFDEGVGGGQVEYGDSAGGEDGQGADIQSVIVTTNTIVEDVALLQPRRQRKRKIGVADASGPSHPLKKLKEDYGALGGAFAAEREDKSHADSVTELNLRTIGALQRFVISSDSFHHSGTNIAEAEVDYIVRSSAPAIATVTTNIADSVPGDFSDVFGSDFLIGGIRTIVEPDFDLQKVYILQWSATNGFGLDDSRICHEMLDEFAPLKFFASIRGMDHDQLFTKFNVKAARQISLSAEVRMRAEYNIRAKRRLRYVVDEQAKLLKAEVFKFEATRKSLQGEVGVLRDYSATLKKEKNELSVKVTDLSSSMKVREQEVADLDAQVTAVKLQNDNLVGQISSVGLQEKVVVYEDFIGQLKKFQDEKMEECLNSTEYLSVLGVAISKAVKKGMQEGLSAGITHGAKAPSECQLLLIAELKSNKDASVDIIMNLLHLDDTLAERLGLTESQPQANQLMDVSHSRVRKIRENIASHVLALRVVFVPVSKPLSTAALVGKEGTSGSAHDTTTALSVTFVSAGTIPHISTDDYEVAHADGQEGASVDGETATHENIDPFLMLATQS